MKYLDFFGDTTVEICYNTGKSTIVLQKHVFKVTKCCRIGDFRTIFGEILICSTVKFIPK